jgi:DegV family protein with EDD domain
MENKIITGGGHALSKELAKKYHIKIVPYSFSIGGQNYLEGELSVVDFLDKAKKIKKAKDFPKTSALSAGLLAKIFTKLPKDEYNIFCVVMSKELTAGTYLALEQAKKIANRSEIKIIDTRQTAMGKDLIAIEIAKFAKQEKTIDEIMEFSKKTVSAANSIFALPNLKYLYYGGRIGKAKILMGSFFKIIPLIGFRNENGIVEPLGKAMTISRTNQKIIEQIKFDLDKKQGSKIKCMISDADNQAAKDNLRQQLIKNFKNIEIIEGEMGCTAICHTGPKSWGVGYAII